MWTLPPHLETSMLCMISCFEYALTSQTWLASVVALLHWSPRGAVYSSRILETV